MMLSMVQDRPMWNGPETMSAPHMHSMCLELLAPHLLRHTGCKVLDVGSVRLLLQRFRILSPAIFSLVVPQRARLCCRHLACALQR